MVAAIYESGPATVLVNWSHEIAKHSAAVHRDYVSGHLFPREDLRPLQLGLQSLEFSPDPGGTFQVTNESIELLTVAFRNDDLSVHCINKAVWGLWE